MHPVLLPTLLLALAAPPGAVDEGTPGAAPAPPSAAAAPGPAPAAAPDLSAPLPPGSLDFDLLEAAPAAAPARDPAFEKRVERRRTLLKLHQGLGLATWASLAATSAAGQAQFDDRFRGGGDTGKWRTPHRVLVVTSTTLFASAGLLALLAPEPYAKRAGRLDTATLHKVSMGVATAGMVAQVILGLAARGKAGTLRERDLAATHQLVGYATLGAMTVGAAVLFF